MPSWMAGDLGVIKATVRYQRLCVGAYGLTITSAYSVTIQSTWDEEEGPCAVCSFIGPGEPISIAANAEGVVEVNENT